MKKFVKKNLKNDNQRSWVWTYFKTIVNEGNISYECRNCKQIYKEKTSTYNLSKHLKKKHKIQPKSKIHENTHKMATRSLVQYVIEKNLPLNSTESKHLYDFAFYLNPQYIVPKKMH